MIVEEKKEEIKAERALEIIKNYIRFDRTMSFDKFCKQNKINKDYFLRCVDIVQDNYKRIYNLYLKVQRARLLIKLDEPITRVKRIINCINTGMNEDGEEFTVCDFYKMAPNKGIDSEKNIDSLLRGISITQEFNDETYSLNKLRQDYIKAGLAKRKNIGSYSEHLYVFTKWVVGDSEADTLKEFMDDNGVNSITRLLRFNEKTKYSSSPMPGIYTADDVEEIFEFMEQKEYPPVRELYEYLKAKRISDNTKKATKANKKLELINESKEIN